VNCLFTFESRRLPLAKIEVAVEPNGLKATAQGETLDESRRVLDQEVKAVTYHRLRVERVNDGWIAEEQPDAYKDVDIVVDVVAKAGPAKKVARLRPIGVIKG
jgi:RNA-splicing ligase RtcB